MGCVQGQADINNDIQIGGLWMKFGSKELGV